MSPIKRFLSMVTHYQITTGQKPDYMEMSAHTWSKLCTCMFTNGITTEMRGSDGYLFGVRIKVTHTKQLGFIPCSTEPS